MLEKIQHTIERFSLLKKNNKVLLCVSGGPDSVAMLHAFHLLSRSRKLKLFVGHFNHHLRGIESKEDEKYVVSLAKKLKIPILLGEEDTNEFASVNKLSLEDGARRLRYNFFLQIAKELKMGLIATAHTKDDQAETVLMKLLRGSGLRGLRGILPKSDLCGVTLIRPLLDVTRKEVEQYLDKRKIKPRIDSSNSRLIYSRNKVRLKLIPYLKKNYSPKLTELLASLSDTLSEDYEYLFLEQMAIFNKLAKKSKNQITFSLSHFMRNHASAQRFLARNAIEELKGDLDNIDFKHWQEIEDLVSNRRVGSIVDLPGKVSVLKTRSALKFYILNKQKQSENKVLPVSVKIPGQTILGDKVIKASLIGKYKSASRLDRSVEYFDFERMKLPLTLRTRQPGDKIMPLGMKRHKKISDIFIDEKTPLKKRDKIMLLTSAAGEILWICGIRISEKTKVSSRTKKILKLQLTKKPNAHHELLT